MKLHLVCWCVANAALLSLGVLGCSVQGPTKEETTGPAPTPTAVAAGEDRPFDDTLLEVASTYKTRSAHYYPVYPAVQMTQVTCGPFTLTPASPPPPLITASNDSATHGRKLYWLFVKKLPPNCGPGEYTVDGALNPVGQVVEAWLPEEINDEGQAADLKENECVRRDGHLYRAATKSGLFIMYKLDPKTPDTDEGWVYGTVSADGKTVTSAGRVQSCMNCHQDAPHDRLFGVAKK